MKPFLNCIKRDAKGERVEEIVITKADFGRHLNDSDNPEEVLRSWIDIPVENLKIKKVEIYNTAEISFSYDNPLYEKLDPSFEKVESKFGKTVYEGEEYELTEYAEYDNKQHHDGCEYYVANAVKGDKQYLVYFEIVDGNSEDGSNACDWENASFVEEF